MDNQMKRGLLDVCVLAAIRNEESYGYQIIKDVKPYISISESTLYPILRRLEDGRAFGGAQRKASEILPYYEAGHQKARGIYGRVEGNHGNLPVRQQQDWRGGE